MWHINLNNVVGHGYDGAAVMSGAAFRKSYAKKRPNICMFIVDCSAHRLNLCLLVDEEDFFAVIGCSYCFLSTSVVHRLWINKERESYSKGQPVELQQFSDTRWSCRVSSCRALLNM